MITAASAPGTNEAVFGAVHLGYLAVESRKMQQWHRFGADAVGLHVDELDDNTLRFRLDDHECRFLIRRGPSEDLMAIGWQIDDHGPFDQILRRVSDRGVPIIEGTTEEAALRGVERLWRFPGPKGITQEIFTTARTSAKPLRMLTSGYVTGTAGMGHVAITSRNPASIHRYYGTLFDARPSDYIDENINGLTLAIRFVRVNERHHSIAVAGLRHLPVDPIRTRAQHVNIQVADLDDMLAAYQRVRDLDFRVAWTVGQHTNDRELSFYCVTPSGFELEIGWNPIVVTPELEAAWQPTTYRGISIWGHDTVHMTDNLARVREAIWNLRRPEQTVPAIGTPIGI